LLCPTLEATSTRAPDWVLLALLRWRSKSSIPGSINECLKAPRTCYVLPWRLPRREHLIGYSLRCFDGVQNPLSLVMAGLVFKQPRRGWIKRQLKIKQRSPLQACLASHKRWHIYPMSCRKVLMISWRKQNRFTLTKSTYKAFMKASLNMMKMASWLNYKRFQTKMNSKSQKFLERGSLLHVLLGLHNPTLRGKDEEAFVLDN